jgi:hypothetical protein
MYPLITFNNQTVEVTMGELLLAFAIRHANIEVIKYLTSCSISCAEPHCDLFVSHYIRANTLGDDIFTKGRSSDSIIPDWISSSSDGAGTSSSSDVDSPPSIFVEVGKAISTGYNNYRRILFKKIEPHIPLLNYDTCYVISQYLIGNTSTYVFTEANYRARCFADTSEEPAEEEEDEYDMGYDVFG